MLTNLTLENFKAFQKLDDLKIKPITILCGTNSCGKSSILQSILLLKQTLESKNLNQSLLLNGRLIKLGYFQDVIFRKNLNTPISFSFTFTITRDIHGLQSERRPPIHWLLGELTGDRHTLNKDTEYLIDYSVSLKAIEGNGNEDSEYLKSLLVNHICLKISEKNADKIDSEIMLSANHIKGNTYAINWKNLKNRFISDKQTSSEKLELEILFANLFPVSFRNIKSNDKPIPNRSNPDITSFFYRSSDIFHTIFSSYSYIGPLRGEPERRYVYEDEVLEIGNKGENAAYLYLTEQNKRIHNHHFYNRSIDSFETLPNQTLHSALQKWFELMKIPNFEAEITNKIIYLNMEASTYDQTRVGIADVGFGVSQIFPIILEGLRMEKGATLMLEQPEIHLHPNLQMQMADYFISLALSGKQVLVETHSDHVINRLVRRIVEDETHNLQDLIGIYFIKPSENGSVYEEVKIDENKGIINWPPDFFDQTANEQMKIMQAGLKKRKNQRIPANGNAS